MGIFIRIVSIVWIYLYDIIFKVLGISKFPTSNNWIKHPWYNYMYCNISYA